MSAWLAIMGTVSMRHLCIFTWRQTNSVLDDPTSFELKQISRTAHMVSASFRGRSITNSSVNSSSVVCSPSMRIWAPPTLSPWLFWKVTEEGIVTDPQILIKFCVYCQWTLSSGAVIKLCLIPRINTEESYNCWHQELCFVNLQQQSTDPQHKRKKCMKRFKVVI